VTFNLTGFSLDILHKNIILYLNDLKYASRKVSDLAKELKEQDWRNHQLFKHHTFSAVEFITVGVTMIYIVFKLYKYLRRHCSNTLCPKIESRMLGKDTTPTRAKQPGKHHHHISTSNESPAITPETIPLQGNPQVKAENPK
jgi:hypothetical protein